MALLGDGSSEPLKSVTTSSEAEFKVYAPPSVPSCGRLVASRLEGSFLGKIVDFDERQAGGGIETGDFDAVTARNE